MRIEVFKIKEDNWGVRFAKGFEVTGFQTTSMAHIWILHWLMQMMGKTLSDEAMKRALKTGQAELDRIINEAVAKEEKEKKNE